VEALSRGYVAAREMAVTEQSIRDTLRGYIFANLLPGESPDTLDDSAPLVTSGVVTSISLLELVTFIEDTFALRFEDEDLGVSRLDSVDLMVALIQERLGSSAARASD
jgi:acyl carrier protein